MSDKKRCKGCGQVMPTDFSLDNELENALTRIEEWCGGHGAKAHSSFANLSEADRTRTKLVLCVMRGLVGECRFPGYEVICDLPVSGVLRLAWETVDENGERNIANWELVCRDESESESESGEAGGPCFTS